MGIESQRALGLRLGLSKTLASSRINRYETQVRGIELDGLGELAQALGVPMAFLVAENDETAEIILALSKMSKAELAKLASRLKGEIETCIQTRAQK